MNLSAWWLKKCFCTTIVRAEHCRVLVHECQREDGNTKISQRVAWKWDGITNASNLSDCRRRSFVCRDPVLLGDRLLNREATEAAGEGGQASPRVCRRQPTNRQLIKTQSLILRLSFARQLNNGGF